VVNLKINIMNYQQKKIFAEFLSLDKCTCGCEERKWITIKGNRPILKLTTLRR
jgi:hypothetical protein